MILFEMSGIESSNIPNPPSDEVLSKIQSTMGAIPKKNISTLSPSCRNTLQACINSSSDLDAILRDLGSQPILTQIYEKLAVIEQNMTRIGHMLGEVTSDTMHCIFCNRDNHITNRCVLNIHRKYQVIGEKQLCSKCLKSYTDAEHIMPCMTRCEKCEEGHHSSLHPTSNKIAIRRPTKAQREGKFTRGQPF